MRESMVQHTLDSYGWPYHCIDGARGGERACSRGGRSGGAVSGAEVCIERCRQRIAFDWQYYPPIERSIASIAQCASQNCGNFAK